MVTRSLLTMGLAATLAACTPDFNDTTAVVAAPRLLGVQASPAEGPTGSAFTLRALYVSPGGTADAGSLAWATCLLQKPLGDPASVNPACLADASSGLAPLGRGSPVTGTIPTNACELFGPESPPPSAGQPSARPTDPDSTGGYYLPVRVAAPVGDDSVAFERIACQPSGVLESVFMAFSSGYVMNENPVVDSLSVVDEEGTALAVPPDAHGSKPATVAPGAVTSLRVVWPSCPAKPGACGGAETYLLIDPSTKAVTTSRESIIASWYASAGGFELDRVGRDGDDDATSVGNTWTAPSTPGTVHLWVVLRDARGGVGWESYTFNVAR